MFVQWIAQVLSCLYFLKKPFQTHFINLWLLLVLKKMLSLLCWGTKEIEITRIRHSQEKWNIRPFCSCRLRKRGVTWCLVDVHRASLYNCRAPTSFPGFFPRVCQHVLRRCQQSPVSLVSYAVIQRPLQK